MGAGGRNSGAALARGARSWPRTRPRAAGDRGRSTETPPWVGRQCCDERIMSMVQSMSSCDCCESQSDLIFGVDVPGRVGVEVWIDVGELSFFRPYLSSHLASEARASRPPRPCSIGGRIPGTGRSFPSSALEACGHPLSTEEASERSKRQRRTLLWGADSRTCSGHSSWSCPLTLQ